VVTHEQASVPAVQIGADSSVMVTMHDPAASGRDRPSAQDARRLQEFFGGYRVSQAIYVMAELGIADLLRDGAQDSDNLAHATESHPPTLYRVLRFLAAHGILEEVAPHRFALTSLGAPLRSEVPGSPRALVRHLLSERSWAPWGRLLDPVRTGETPFGLVHGMTSFDHLDQHAEAAVLFSQALSTATVVSGSGTATTGILRLASQRTRCWAGNPRFAPIRSG